MASLGIERGSDELVREQFRLISQQIPLMYAVIIVNCFFLSLATWTNVGAFLAFAFPVFAVPIMLIRVYVWRKRAAQRRADGDVAKMRSALKGNIITANVMAAALAIWAISMMMYIPREDVAFIPLFTIFCMMVCAYCLTSYPVAAYSVLFSGGTYITASLAVTGDPVLLAMAANIAMVSGLILYMVSRQFKQLRRLVSSHSELDDQRAYADELAHQDQLTGLPNRRAFVNALRSRHNEAAQKPVGLVMIDMNGFKPVNDTYGHAAGDRLLAILGKRLAQTVGQNGFLARLGGDEFCVLLPHPRNMEWLYSMAEAMMQAISRPLDMDGHQLHVGASIGIAAEGSMPDNPLELMQHADIALYEAKAKEGSAISVFERRMEARVKRRTMIEQALSDPAQMEAIEMNFQPIYELHSGRQIGFEALARWQHPTIGTINPAEFVDAAERNGLATRLTIHLFRQAVKTAMNWDDSLLLSFNLSGSGLGASGLDRVIPQILAEMGMPPSRLSVEVTETALLSDTQSARELLQRLQKLGVRIVLDDFGAGYASIGYLRKLHFDGIKLDGSLIRDVTRNEKSRQLLLGVLQLCQAIGASVTAEMVESDEQLALLRALPVNNVQGYLFGRPISSALACEKWPEHTPRIHHKLAAGFHTAPAPPIAVGG